MENIQNMQPNCPQLAQLIRQNLTYHYQQSVKKTLFKESMVKISLDKDFEHIFNHEIPIQPPRPILLQAPQQVKGICSWLQQSDTYGGMAHLPTQMMPKLIHILHQKVQSLAIILTEYQSWWMNKMQEMGRLSTLKWGFLNPSLTNDEKVKVLELYELKKLKLLFISPSLFKTEGYYELQCDLLVVCDLHLYLKDSKLLNMIATKTSPSRLLGIHNTLTHQQFEKLQLPPINTPSHLKYNFIVLKTPIQDKSKTIVSYVAKNNLKNVLIIVNRKNQLPELIRKLQMQSLAIFNMFDALTPSQISSFTSPQILYNIDKKEEYIMEIVRKASTHNITLSTYFDPLRLANFDGVIFYSFVEVKKFVDWCPQISNKLMLLVDDDFYTARNNITSDYMMSDHLQKILMRLMEKPKKKFEGNKRFYSQDINDKMMECFSVSKDDGYKIQEKVIKMNLFCKNFDVSYKLLKRILDLLASKNIIEIIHKIPCQIQIEEETLPLFKKLYPKARQLRKKVDLLHLSSSLQRTTFSILTELKSRDIKYKIAQEAVQFSLLQDYEQIESFTFTQQLNKTVEEHVNRIDKSYEMFKQCAYGSIQLTRREKILCRKEKLIHFLSNKIQFSRPNVLDSSHRSNLLTAEIEEWIRNSQQRLDQHDLITMLQGVDKTKMTHFKKDSIYGRYKRYKYQEIQQAIQRITKNKRIKL